MGYQPIDRPKGKKPPPPPSPPPKPPKGGTGVVRIKPQQYECEYCGSTVIVIEDSCPNCGARKYKLT